MRIGLPELKGNGCVGWNRPASLLELALTASALNMILYYFQDCIVLKKPNGECAGAALDVAGPRIVGILLPIVGAIDGLHYSQVHNNLSVNRHVPCSHSQTFSCARRKGAELLKSDSDRDAAKKTTTIIRTSLSSE